jgi:hypothetical protein
MELSIKLFAIAWFVTNFELLQDFLEALYGKHFIFDQFLNVATCFKCLTFWLVLIGTFNPFYAIFAAMTAVLYDRFTT